MAVLFLHCTQTFKHLLPLKMENRFHMMLSMWSSPRFHSIHSHAARADRNGSMTGCFVLELSQDLTSLLHTRRRPPKSLDLNSPWQPVIGIDPYHRLPSAVHQSCRIVPFKWGHILLAVIAPMRMLPNVWVNVFVSSRLLNLVSKPVPKKIVSFSSTCWPRKKQYNMVTLSIIKQLVLPVPARVGCWGLSEPVLLGQAENS